MLSKAVKELQQRKSQIASQIKSLEAEAQKLNTAISVLSSLAGGGAVSGSGKGKYTRTAAQRAAMAKAQKARWAKIKTGPTAVAKSAKKRKKMSAAAKKRLSEFQKARWAKIKAAKKK